MPVQPRLVSYYPMFFVIGYLSFCLTAGILGPVEYRDYNKLVTAIFVGLTLVAFAIGFGLGTNAPLRISRKMGHAGIEHTVSKLFQVCLILASISTLIIFAQVALEGSLSLNISNSGAAYFAAYEGYERNTGSYGFTFLLSSFSAFPVFLTMIWGIYYLRSFSYRRKILIVSIILITIVVFTISGGKQKQFGDILVYSLTLYFIGAIVGQRFKVKAVLIYSMIASLGVVVLLALLTARYATIGINLSNINAAIHPLMTFDETHVINRVFGDHIGFAMSVFSSYLGQGFYGLSLALDHEFTWTAFGGSSYSWSVILNRFLGFPFMVEQSYPYLVGDTTGWASTKWHSLYAWLASDFTFTGTVFLNVIIGYIFGQLWKEILFCENPFSILFFCLLSVGAIYAPANNQLMHTPGGLFTLILTVFFYYRYRGAYNFQKLKLDNRI